MRFADKVVAVTGAARGIGRAIAEAFVQEGARVFAADIDPAEPIPGAESVRCDVAWRRMCSLSLIVFWANPARDGPRGRRCVYRVHGAVHPVAALQQR